MTSKKQKYIFKSYKFCVPRASLLSRRVLKRKFFEIFLFDSFRVEKPWVSDHARDDDERAALLTLDEYRNHDRNTTHVALSGL